MPGKRNRLPGGGFNVLDDIVFEKRVGHAKRFSSGMEGLLINIITILAVEIAESAYGFGENLKFTGSFDHFRSQ